MLSAVEDKQATLAKIPDALEGGEFSEVGSLVEEADKENGAAEGMAKHYGLKVCGSEE